MYRSKKYRPLRWIGALYARTPYGKHMVPLSLRLTNYFMQRVIGLNCNVPFQVHFTSSITGDIVVADDVKLQFAISGGCYVQGINGVIIKRNTLIAPGVKIISANHDISRIHSHRREGPIIIEEDCWLGANAVILPGVRLGRRCIVAAGSVVNKSFEGTCIIGGVPAKVLKYL